LAFGLWDIQFVQLEVVKSWQFVLGVTHKIGESIIAFLSECLSLPKFLLSYICAAILTRNKECFIVKKASTGGPFG
jgi:hypothetical protein